MTYSEKRNAWERKKLAASAESLPLIHKPENHTLAWKKGFIEMELKMSIHNQNKN